MRHKTILFIIMIFATILNGQNISDGFNFYLPPQDTTRQQFLPYFPAVHISAEDYITISGGGHFMFRDQPIRFFGTNLVADGAFPLKEKAWFIAGRLRKMGFNLVRFHHIDNPWSDASLFYQGSSTRQLNSETLDRLEYLIYQLKLNGILVNMNLHVSRTFRVEDGVPDADQIPNYGKGVTYFDPYLIELQKEYAQQLLWHVNPYSGLRLADDPVMAMVEIINENSLYRMWRDGKLKPIAQGGDLTDRHNAMLDSMWHAFLKQEYDTNENLAATWNIGVREEGADEQIPDNGFEQGNLNQNWFLEQHSPAAATMSLEENTVFMGTRSVRVDITSTDGVDWHIQLKKTGLSIKKDSLYTIRFAARASTPRSIMASVMKDTDPWTTYGSSSFFLTTQWQEFSFTVRAPVDLNQETRLSFQLAGETGACWFDEIYFHSGSVSGLLANESLDLENVSRLDFFQTAQYTDNRVRDMSRFYLKIQSDFFAEMHTYLKNVLGVKVPIVGTNWNVGPGDMVTQAQMDFIDNHAYWDHPAFPGIPWSATDWYINNTAMVLDQGGGAISGLIAGVGQMNKPFTLSEYNHAFPNRYQSEGVLFLTAYASFHDVDGLMFFDYGGSVSDWETDFINGYFGIHRNPAMMSLIPSCAFAYRQGFISPAQETYSLSFSENDILLLPKYDNGWWSGPELYPKTIALQHGLRNETFSATSSFDPSTLPAAPASPYTSDTGEIIWNTDGLMTTVTERFVGITGFLQQNQGQIVGGHRIIDGSPFATFTWVSLDSQPLTNAKHSLMTLSSTAQNLNMIWDGTTTVHDNWGTSPTVLDRSFIRLLVSIFADSIRIYPLNTTGMVTQYSQMYYPSAENKFVVKLDQDVDQTTWFGVEAYGGAVSVPENEHNSTVRRRYALSQNYPNPFNAKTVINYELPVTNYVDLSIYNLLGQKLVVLVSGEKPAGTYKVEWDSGTTPSGIYLYRFSTGSGFSETKKLILLK